MADNDPFTWLDFERWKADVYKPNHDSVLKELRMIMATISRLDSVVTRMENVASTAEKVSSSTWTKLGVVAVLLTPILTALATHFWK
jgi:hypothetical protein